MFRGLARAAVWLAAFVFFLAGAAMADTLTFANNEGTATGSFTYDATTNKILDYNFSLSSSGTGAPISFGATTYNSADTAIGTSSIVVSNPNGDEVFSFFEIQPSQSRLDEFDIVIACGGVANCVTQATEGNSFAIVSGNCGPTCVSSGEQTGVPENITPSRFLGPNNFINITDPTCPVNDSCFTMSLSTTSTGTILGGGGGDTTGVPEPSTLLLSALGLGGLALKRFSRREQVA